MTNRIVVLLAAVASAFACAELIDLGSEATVEQQNDSGGDGGAAGAPCGIPAQASEACNSCWQDRCCEEGRVCAQDEECYAGSRALDECLFDVPCILQVNEDYANAAGFPEFSECIAACGSACLPTGDCLELAECCQQITDDFVRDPCLTTIHAGDQERCREMLTTLLGSECTP